MDDIVIRGMEIPKEPTNVTIYPDGAWCDYATNNQHGKFVILPEGHGRLGDLDKLEESLRMVAAYQAGERQQGMLGCCETIRMAKTIIEAEGG